MRILIEMNTDNAAFADDNWSYETARVMRKLVDDIELANDCMELDGKRLHDINGNHIGTVKIEAQD